MEKKREEIRRPRTRTRATDFHSIENPSHNTPLTPYQLEVKEKLARSPSSLDRLIRREEFLKKKKAQIQIRRRVLRNQRYAGLTPKQREALRLCYQRYSKNPDKRKRPVPLRKIAKRLGITTSSASSRLKGALRKIEKLGERRLEGQRITRLITRPLYRTKLRNVFHLYFERLWPPKKIAQALRSSLASVYKNIRTLQWLAHSYSPEEAQVPQVHHYRDEENQPRKIVVSVKKPSKKPAIWTKSMRRG